MARINRASEHALHDSRSQLQSASARLHALSPLAVLDRGYALVQNSDGLVVRSVAQLTSGDRVTTRLSDGSFASRVEDATKPETVNKSRTRK